MKTYALFLSALIFVAASIGFSKEDTRFSSLSLVTRDGKVSMRVIYDMWSSEYPGPVIDVNSRVKNKTTVVQAFASIQNLSAPIKCEIKNGLYHPWSRSGNSAKGYKTVAQNVIYKVIVANTDLDLDGKVSVLPRMVISEVVYLSEGFCSGVVLDNQSSPGKTVITQMESFYCSDVENEQKFEKLSDESVAPAMEQWIELGCRNGQTAYITDSALLATSGVKEGEILDYGSVGPAPKP